MGINFRCQIEKRESPETFHLIKKDIITILVVFETDTSLTTEHAKPSTANYNGARRVIDSIITACKKNTMPIVASCHVIKYARFITSRIPARDHFNLLQLYRMEDFLVDISCGVITSHDYSASQW